MKLQGAASRRTRSFQELPKNTLHKFWSKVKTRVTKKLSQDFSRTESRNLAGTFKLDDFLLNPQVGTLYGTVPGTSRNNDRENQKQAGGRSQNDLNPEVEFSVRRTRNSVDSDWRETSHFYNFVAH